MSFFVLLDIAIICFEIFAFFVTSFIYFLTNQSKLKCGNLINAKSLIVSIIFLLNVVELKNQDNEVYKEINIFIIY